MVNLNLGQRKLYFLVYATGVTGYRLWCPDPKSPKFVISRDITFDENYMLQPRKEFVVDITGSREEASKQIVFESKVTEGVQESTRVEPVDDAQGSTSSDDTLQEQQYSIAIRRARRQIRPPKRYAYADMVGLCSKYGRIY